MDEIQGKNSPSPDPAFGGTAGMGSRPRAPGFAERAGTRRFIIGVIFIIGSIAYGWIGLFVCNALAVKYGKFCAVLGWIIYGVSWITYGIGFILAGAGGVSYAKRLFKRLFLLQGKKR